MHRGELALESGQLAMKMWSITRSQQQCALVVPDDGIAREVRERVRRLALADGIKVRTARLGDSVVIVRLDAQIWTEDTATMRRKLTPE